MRARSTPCAKRCGDRRRTARRRQRRLERRHEAVEQLKRLAPFKLSVIEQPVAADDLAGMKQVRDESGIPVMADESLVTSIRRAA